MRTGSRLAACYLGRLIDPGTGKTLRLAVTRSLRISLVHGIALQLGVSLLAISLRCLISLVRRACLISILGKSVLLGITGELGLILVIMLHVFFLSAGAVIIKNRIEKL